MERPLINPISVSSNNHEMVCEIIIVAFDKVIDLTERRISAKLVEKFAKDITPKKEWNKLRNDKPSGTKLRKDLKGRPSKKERRLIDKFMELGGST